MTTNKQRLTVTVDPDLVQCGNESVAAGRAESLSAWVNLALRERVARERRLGALGEAVAAYESEFGAITPDELAAQQRADRAAARVVRGGRGAAKARRRGAA